MRRILLHLNQSLSNIMSNREQTKKLWQQIGLEKVAVDLKPNRDNNINKDLDSIVLSGESMQEIRAEWICSSRKSSDISRSGKRVIQEEQLHADRFQRMMEALDVQVQQVEQTEAIQIVTNESHIQQVVDYSIENEKEPHDFYNEDISKLPQSITPLVYSKNSKAIEQITFRKHKARVSLLKMTVCEARQCLDLIRQSLMLFFEEVKLTQQKLREEISLKHFEVQQQYQLRLQQALFHQRQEHEQLRYDYQILRGREEITGAPIKSELILHEIEGSEIKTKAVEESQQLGQLLKQNFELKQRVDVLQTQRQKMLNEASEFKRKMAGIEATTFAVKDSNDKLYEYIFDLEQQIAFHKEQIPKITSSIRKELNENYNKQIEELEEERQNVITQLEELQIRTRIVTEERNQIGLKLQATQNELTQLKINLQNKNEEIQRLEQLCLSKSEEINSIIQQNEERHNQYNQLKKIIEQKDQTILQQTQSLKKIKLQTPTNSRAYETTSYSRQKPIQSTGKDFIDLREKEDKKMLQNLQIQKLVLQKQNLHLKAAVQFYNKNYGPYLQGYQQILSPRQHTSHSIENHYQSTQDRVPSVPQQFIADSNLQLKERQLLKYQNYLQSQARKLQVKQREIESDYAIKQSIQQRHRQSALTAQRSYKNLINQDDYGMKNVAAVNLRSYNGVPSCVQQQRSQFCSSEAQAIIQRVKKRQKNNQVCCHSRCQNAGSCRCDALSKGSRGSRESDSKEYFRTQHYRPQNRSPSIRMEEYFRTEDRNSKMKLIEDKVKRLKSELKTSLTSMKSQ